ncbi:MAG: acyl-CoA dehydrogenase domain protein [Microbacteriaceae bacterium]|nr:acyl-CoA dehydrogenase domain protein [Microbacteriaceae bacterium]
MDFSPTEGQATLLASIDAVVESRGGRERVARVATSLAYDGELDAQLRSTIDIDSLSLLDRVLASDRLAQAGAATTWASRSIVLGNGNSVEGPLVVVDRARSGLTRYAPFATAALVFDGDESRLVQLEPVDVEEVPSGAGYPVGRITDAAMAGGQVVGGAELRNRWMLALATEAGGLAAAAVTLTSNHLQRRKQFGKPLAQFQALRHRVANHAVSAESIRWMVRFAADHEDERAMALAAAYAGSTAAELSPEFVQLWGARGLAHEFGVSTYLMRLEGIRLELGSRDRLAEAVLTF